MKTRKANFKQGEKIIITSGQYKAQYAIIQGEHFKVKDVVIYNALMNSEVIQLAEGTFRLYISPPEMGRIILNDELFLTTFLFV